MKIDTLHKLGAISLVAGALCLAAYAVLFSTYLPTDVVRRDITAAIVDPHWVPIALTAMLGIVLLMFGFAAVYSRLWDRTGVLGLAGFVAIELAYLLQACKVTWEICLYPVIVASEGSIWLLRDGIIQHAPLVTDFRIMATGSILAGIVLFCLAIVRSKAFSRAAGVLVFLGALVYGVGPLLSVHAVLGGIATFALGCLLLGRDMTRAAKPAATGLATVDMAGNA